MTPHSPGQLERVLHTFPVGLAGLWAAWLRHLLVPDEAMIHAANKDNEQ